MKYQTMRIDHLNHLYIEASAGEVRFTVNGDALVVEPVLSEKKPRTKVEYVKCDFESFSDVYSSILSGGEVYGYEVDGYRPRCYLDESGSFIWRYKERCASYSGLKGVDINQLYRRIETPMTEREAFVDECKKFGGLRARDGADEVYGNLFDSGKFKLVN